MSISHGRAGTRRVMLISNSTWNLAHFRRPVIDALVAKGYEVLAAAPADRAAEELEALGVRLLPLTFRPGAISPLSDMRLARDLARLMRQVSPDVVLTFTIKPNIYGGFASRVTGIPTVPTISGIGSAMMGSGPMPIITRRLFAPALKKAPAIFFQNSEDRDLFVARGLANNSQVRLVPGSGIDPSHFAQLPLPADEPFTFLMIGRLLRDKGVVELAEASRILRAEGRQFRMIVLGSADADNPTAIASRLVDEWVAEGVLEHLDHRQDVRAVIAKAHCVILPSYREGLSRSLLEGASMGRPLIATDVPGCRDVVEDGINGFLCAPRSAAELAEAMRRMMDLDPAAREAMGAASRGLVENRFDQQLVADAYVRELHL